MVGAGDDGPAGGPLDVSQTLGSPEVTLTSADLPPALGGSSQPFNNYQPSLAVNYIINIGGDYPDLGGGSAEENMLGVVIPFAGNFAPEGWAFADGQLLPINGNTALFSLLGTTYGGDGITNFALPDLEGRDIVGAGDGYDLGEQVGQPTVALSNDQVPDASTAAASSLDNQQPGLVAELSDCDQRQLPTYRRSRCRNRSKHAIYRPGCRLCGCPVRSPGRLGSRRRASHCPSTAIQPCFRSSAPPTAAMA